MSLLVCSSKQARYGFDEQGNSRPYQFTNYLGNPLRIPPNSEVAVQSVKLNRRGKFQIKQGENDTGYIIWGYDYTATEDYENAYVQSLLPFTIQSGDYTEDEYKSALKYALSQACVLHPNLRLGSVTYKVVDSKIDSLKITLTQPTSSAMDDTLGKTDMKTKWLPYGITTEETGSSIETARSLPTRPPAGTDLTERFPTFETDAATGLLKGWDKDAYTFGSRDVVANSSGHTGVNACIMPQGYMSAGKGVFRVGIGELIGAKECAWTMGLVRAQSCGSVEKGVGPDGVKTYDRYNEFIGNDDGNVGLPYGFRPHYLPFNIPETKGWNELEFADYQVRSMIGGGTAETGPDVAKHYLRVFGSGHLKGGAIDPDDREELDLGFGPFNADDNEVKYWLRNTLAFTGIDADTEPYCLTDDGDEITSIQFKLEGAVLTLIIEGKYGDPAVSDKVVIGARGLVEGTDDEAFAPIVATKYRLYPKLVVDNEVGAQTRYFNLDLTGVAGSLMIEHSAEEKTLQRDYGKGWYGLNCLADRNDNNEGESNLSSDCRILNQIGSTWGTTTWGGAGAGIIADGQVDFGYGFILDELDDEDWDDNEFNPAYFADGSNSQDTLGFDSAVILNTEGTLLAGPPQTWEIIGAHLPEGIATSSLFVSCPTLTSTSHNFSKGTPSSILYHMPLFDNSTGKSVGPLFFESPEKTYLRLGNTDTLELDHLNIAIVDCNEELASEGELEGNTIIVLHIRPERR